ncbi:N1221-domain-containing protein [Wolfiporia cocos MD-104 SS10]|uniref:N1221-domain-containing protein n=1 Tax=Wolfiporia cocos (strain MD-104) TaxID=742152 RepID=A0A2H3JYA4_WOLCO|nr:N1221-domain-containing protein [Wolfiporia cocos MD-104 SS10]
MVFPQFQSYMAAQQQDNGGGGSQGLDSITLGQLKAMVGSAPKPKQSYYDFKYDDEDTVLNEIEEFYSYVEMPQVAENLKAWEGSFPGEWVESPLAQRKAHVEVLLESLEHRDAEIRFTNARRLLYVLQGTFAETLSPEHQLHWIFENCKVVRAANGLSNIVEAIKIASSKHDLLCSLSDADAARFNISPQERADFMEEVTTELSVYLGMLYHMVEVFKGHDDFADELMSLDPPLPVYLFNVVAGLRDKSAKGYPVKKLLLVLWKTVLTCCGGIRELARVKKLSRELAGLPPVSDEAIPIKASPLDIEAFRQEISVKYPTFTALPPPITVAAPVPSAAPAPVVTSKLAQAYSPIPVRHHYDHDDSESQQAGMGGGGQGHPFHPMQQGSGFRPMQQPATPAPSPPPSPKPKKQQFQTDQSRPFLFPFSRSQARSRGSRLVPYAIDEADKLYAKHMYVSMEIWQMWKTREECMTAESGLERMPGSDPVLEPRLAPTTSPQDETAETLPDVAMLDALIAEAENAMAQAESGGDKRKLKERREDLMRLKRVEQIYSAVLPVLQGWVLVLLKLLLATVSAATNGPPQSSTSANFPPGVPSPALEQPPAPPPTLDEIDVTRHREITSKAVSAILLLTLKWFKVSHAMKFHHLGQQLLDTNCLLLILKMFGLQEVSVTVVSKADSPENNFFRYCQSNFARNPQPNRPEDNMLKAPRQTITRITTLPNGLKHEEEVDMLTDFSWRNFFSIINFAKIMQKLSKHRSHRIRMLVQYKSSAVLKRILKVQHPMLQLHVLKLIKSQVPFCGRKWRQSNMQVITAIYLNCRPDLRDEWLTGIEVDDVVDAQAQEQALRHLVKFYNTKRYGAAATYQPGAHRRAASISHHLEGLHPGPELSNLIRPLGTPTHQDADVFPPLRAQAPDPSIFLPYITEDIAFEEEYAEYMSDLGWADDHSATSQSLAFSGSSAWHRLPEYADIADGISDSESIASIGDLGDEGRLEVERDVPDENLNNWEHMSPKTMAALTKSPASRRSNSGNGLRPILPFNLDQNSAIADDNEDDDDEQEVGPMPRDPRGPFHAGAGGVDEVEYVFNM